MAETYSFPVGTIETDTLNFIEGGVIPTPLSIYQREQNLAYLHNLSLSGDEGSSGLIYKANSSIMRPFENLTFDGLMPGMFDISILEFDENNEPRSILITLNTESVLGDNTTFWASNIKTSYLKTNLASRGIGPPEGGDDTQPPPVIQGCDGIVQLCGNFHLIPMCCGILSFYTCPWWCVGCQGCYTYHPWGFGCSCGSGFSRSAFLPPSDPSPEKYIRFSKISGASASEDTYSFAINSLEVVGDKTFIYASLPNPEDKVCFCTRHKCRCSRVGATVCCCFWQDCEKKCENGPCKEGFGNSGGSIFAFTQESNPQIETQPAKAPCQSCKKKLGSTQQSTLSTSSTPQIQGAAAPSCVNPGDCPPGLRCINGVCALSSFAMEGEAYLISIVESENTTYNQNLDTSTTNGIIYDSKNDIIPLIATDIPSDYSTSAFKPGTFDVALNRISNTFSSYTSSSDVSVVVSPTSSWPKYSLTDIQFDYKEIAAPTTSSGISVSTRYYYQLAINRSHPDGTFNSILNNLDGGYRVNLNFQLASASIVSPTYSGPKSFSTVLHNYSTLTGSIVTLIMSSTFSLPSLVRSSFATMSHSGTKIFAPANKYQLSFNQSGNLSSNGSEDNFWLPLVSSTSDKLLNIQQIGSTNNWKFRISGSSSKVKTNSRALIENLNVYEYIFSDASLVSSNITDPSYSIKPNTFPSNVQYNISYVDYISTGFDQVSFNIRESSIFATASTYSVYLTEPLEEGEMVIKRVAMTTMFSDISGLTFGATTSTVTQFSQIPHLQANSIPVTMSQTFVAFRPTQGGQEMFWYKELESNFQKFGVTTTTYEDGLTTTITKGKPQLVRLNINNCPDCPDGNTMEFDVSSITKLVTGEVIIGNHQYTVTRTYDYGDYQQVCKTTFSWETGGVMLNGPTECTVTVSSNVG